MPKEAHRPIQPVYQQFGERSTAGAAAPIGRGSGERRGKPLSLDKPIDLVGNIRTLVQQAGAEWRGKEPFNPAIWLGNNLYRMAEYASLENGTVLLPQQEREGAADKQNFLSSLRIAWYLRAYEEVDGENNYHIFEAVQSYAASYQTATITLPPLGVMLLDAMSEALEIPDYMPGQARFNVEPLLTGSIEKVMSGKNPMPTIEEVKRATATKSEEVVDSEQ